MYERKNLFKNTTHYPTETLITIDKHNDNKSYQQPYIFVRCMYSRQQST